MVDAASTAAAVSEPFAEISRKASFPRTVAISNGVPRLTPVARQESATGRVRPGHIGGRTAHKEAIGQGVSGFWVDAGSPDGPRAVFQRIDVDPERFRASPPQPSHPPRAAADPGEDLIALYDRLLAP